MTNHNLNVSTKIGTFSIQTLIFFQLDQKYTLINKKLITTYKFYPGQCFAAFNTNKQNLFVISEASFLKRWAKPGTVLQYKKLLSQV
jgi:hypothetical protein